MGGHIGCHSMDTASTTLDSLIWTWGQLRTTAARYAEALLHMQKRDFAAADSVVRAIPSELELRPKELDERARMLAYIDLLGSVYSNGRTEAQMDSAEVAQMWALVHGANDRPANWMENLLCVHYKKCRPAYTGGGSSAPKSLPYTALPVVDGGISYLRIHPNPANAFVAFDYLLERKPTQGTLIVRDIAGRIIHRMVIAQEEGQLVWDSRSSTAGAYTVEIRDTDEIIVPVQKLILEQ